jgi:hypothetical protein
LPRQSAAKAGLLLRGDGELCLVDDLAHTMQAIYLNEKSGGSGDSVEQFQKEFLLICNEHQNDGRALAFAFILYDFEHPQIAKILRDEDYWGALNAISGSYLTVFSFRQQNPNATFDNSRKFISDRFKVELPESNPSILFFQVVGDQIYESFVVDIESEMIEEAFIEIKHILLTAVKSVEQVLPENRRNKSGTFNLIVNAMAQRKAFLRIKKVVTFAKSVKELY